MSALGKLRIINKVFQTFSLHKQPQGQLPLFTINHIFCEFLPFIYEKKYPTCSRLCYMEITKFHHKNIYINSSMCNFCTCNAYHYRAAKDILTHITDTVMMWSNTKDETNVPNSNVCFSIDIDLN